MNSERGPHGCLLIDKPEGISSFGVVEQLQRALMDAEKIKKRELPKIGHGGTLDPFATGLLILCVGRGVKLSRYFLGSGKTYEGVIRFGETTVPGDPTAPISEISSVLPESREQIQEFATRLTLQPYLQTPPMHSAKKKGGRPLYELAREGIEVEREAKLCQLHSFEILSYENRRAPFRVSCSSGTYIRTLAQDLGKLLGSVAMLDSLRRTASGLFSISSSMTLAAIVEATTRGEKWDELSSWIPFDRMLEGFDRAEATAEESTALINGRQNVLFNILKRVQPGTKGSGEVAIYSRDLLIAVASRSPSAPGETSVWGLERVFPVPR